MSLMAFSALARRDLRLFFMDKRALTMSFVAPIVIGSFFGYLFGGVGKREVSKIAVTVVDQDQSAVSKRVIASLAADKALKVGEATAEVAREQVRKGTSTVGVVVPRGFSERAVKAFFRGQNRPEVQLLYDPSHATELQMVRGVLTQHVMEAASAEAFGGASPEGAQGLAAAGPRGGIRIPYTVKEEAVTARAGVAYNSMAHSFAGMSVQFILFMGIDAGMIVLMQRRTGMWKRLQAAPISRFTVIASRAASATVIALIILTVVFGFARVVFGVKVEGSFAGFVGICAAFSLMTASFGLLIAVLGKTPEGTRGISILVTLLMVMLGGSWVPAFLFPQWLQRVSFAVPTRWAVDGLDAMLWRGMDFATALPGIGALLGFAVLFGAVAIWRFRWETDG